MKKEKKSKKEDDSLASDIESSKEEKEEETGLLNIEHGNMIGEKRSTVKREPALKPKDISIEEEFDIEKPDTKETLEETVEEEVLELSSTNLSYNELEEQKQFSYASSSSSQETSYNAGQNTSSNSSSSAYEGSVPGSYEGTSSGGGAYVEGTTPDQGRSHEFYNPDNPTERVGEIREKRSSLETTSQEIARDQKKNTFKPQRY